MVQIKHKSKMDDRSRAWIADNLLQDKTPHSIAETLVRNGIEPKVAQQEIMAALNHPYMRAGAALASKYKKQKWVLDIYRTLEKELPSFGTVERRHKLSRAEFLRDYYTASRPVIIQGMMENWQALHKWTPDYLKAGFGDRIVEVQTNRNADKQFEINMDHHRTHMRFGDYIDLIHNAGSTNDYYMTAYNSSLNGNALQGLWDDIDLLPEYLDTKSDRRGFLWYGPAGTITPLHHDLTNNFMAQVKGRKLVKLIPVSNTPYVYNHWHCYSQLDMDDIDLKRFPAFANATVIEVVLEPGEVLFLPIGWWHYVRGLDITITMSFTNFLFNNDFNSFYTTPAEIGMLEKMHRPAPPKIQHRTDISPDWLSWIDENIARGCDPKGMIQILIANNFDEKFVSTFVQEKFEVQQQEQPIQ